MVRPIQTSIQLAEVSHPIESQQTTVLLPKEDCVSTLNSCRASRCSPVKSFFQSIFRPITYLAQFLIRFITCGRFCNPAPVEEKSEKKEISREDLLEDLEETLALMSSVDASPEEVETAFDAFVDRNGGWKGFKKAMGARLDVVPENERKEFLESSSKWFKQYCASRDMKVLEEWRTLLQEQTPS